MPKKVLSILLALVLLVGCAIPTYGLVGDTGFADVDAGAWYADSVTYCRDNHLMSGVGNDRFAPGNSMNHAMLATVLYRIAGSPEATAANRFTDVPAGQWYTDAILWADANGYASGYGNGLFGTNDPVRREQIATILWRYAGSPEVGKDAEFADAAQISTFALEAVDWARANGIVNGKAGKRFDPKGNATRAEVATMLMNYHKLIHTDPTPSPDPTTSPNPTPSPALTPEPNSSKVLVAYFSATNTTEGVAQRLAGSMDADIYEIDPEVPYTSADLNYSNSDCRANQEQNNPSARPAISGSVENMEQYDVVFIGYPIWWGLAPKIMYTFMESYDFPARLSAFLHLRQQPHRLQSHESAWAGKRCRLA